MIRIGLVGCGKAAEKHLGAYLKMPAVEVTVTDVTAVGRRLAERYGVVWNPEPEALLGGGVVDAIDVCTPTATHAEVILAALDGGHHVFCEKPLARSLVEIDAIEQRSRECNAILIVGYLFRFHPAIAFARRILCEGVIGDPYFATFRLGGRGGHAAWKHSSRDGGGAGSEMLVHMLDLALWYFGEPNRVVNLHTDTVRRTREINAELVEADAEDLVLVQLDMERDVRVFCESDLITPGYMNHIEVQGANGSLFTSLLDYLPTLVFCKESRGAHAAGQTRHEFPAIDLFERQLSHFVGCIERGSVDGAHSVADSRRVTEIITTVLPARDSVRPFHHATR
jgi:predicted dehydrogenase